MCEKIIILHHTVFEYTFFGTPGIFTNLNLHYTNSQPCAFARRVECNSHPKVCVLKSVQSVLSYLFVILLLELSGNAARKLAITSNDWYIIIGKDCL